MERVPRAHPCQGQDKKKHCLPLQFHRPFPPNCSRKLPRHRCTLHHSSPLHLKPRMDILGLRFQSMSVIRSSGTLGFRGSRATRKFDNLQFLASGKFGCRNPARSHFQANCVEKFCFEATSRSRALEKIRLEDKSRSRQLKPKLAQSHFEVDRIRENSV